MNQQAWTQDLEPFPQAADGFWQAFFFATDSGQERLMTAGPGGLDAWSSDQLLGEVLERSAEDAPALRLMQGKVLRALLTAIDRDSPAARRQR